MSVEVCSLLNRMLNLEPTERITIEAALQHCWILNQPLEDEEAKELLIKTRRHKREQSRTHTQCEGKNSKGLWHKYFGKKDGILKLIFRLRW
jgi:hypothetical protein